MLISMSEHYPEYERPVGDEVINEMAQRVVDLVPWLRAMSAADEESWLRLHLRLTELGGLTPVETSVLNQLVQGVNPSDIIE